MVYLIQNKYLHFQCSKSWLQWVTNSLTISSSYIYKSWTS